MLSLRELESLSCALCPYFFLSVSLGSLVKKPSFLSFSLRSLSIESIAREIPCLSAPACPERPPPTTFAVILYLPDIPVSSKGLSYHHLQCLTGEIRVKRFFIYNYTAVAGDMLTLAIEDFLRPVALCFISAI